jgi:hypothetical protein
VEEVVLSDREARSLLQIERNLRAEDDRFTRSFEAFRVDLDLVFPDQSERPLVSMLILRTRWALSVAVLALIPLAWVVAVASSGDLAAFSRILVLPLSALLLAVGLVLHPDRRRRGGPGWRTRP